MILKILIDKLEAAGLGKIQGKDATLFFTTMPAHAEQGVVLKTPLTGVEIDGNLPGYYKSEIQAIVRSADYVKGSELTQKVFDTLPVTISTEHIVGNRKIRINFLRPLHLPIQFPRLDGNGIEWSINYAVSFTDLPV